jgi:hypothetical protein
MGPAKTDKNRHQHAIPAKSPGSKGLQRPDRISRGLGREVTFSTSE